MRPPLLTPAACPRALVGDAHYALAYHQVHHGIKQPHDGPAGSAHVGAGQRAGLPLPPRPARADAVLLAAGGGGRAKTAAFRSDQKRKSEASPNDVALAIF